MFDLIRAYLVILLLWKKFSQDNPCQAATTTTGQEGRYCMACNDWTGLMSLPPFSIDTESARVCR